MANVTEQGSTNFILGLSDLWVRMFKDRPTIEALYAGMEIVVGQAYLDILSNVLNISIRETPLFRKEFFHLLTVREDLVAHRSASGEYEYEITGENLRSFQFLYNKIFAPTTILENGIHFDIENEEKDLVVFKQNPFDWDGSGQPVPGVAYRSLDVVVNGVTTRVRELAFWVPDAQFDRYDLYLNYGYLLNHFAPSSEAYRALLRGIIQYFVLGPTERHLTSALNLILGLPLVRNDGEILQSVDTSDPAYRVVKTSHTNYQFDARIPLRSDILDETNWGTLTFNAFEHLSAVFTVYDAVNNPAWYFDEVIPTHLLPNEPRIRREISPVMYENKVNNPPGLVKVGDPGFIVGADEDGTVPINRTPATSYRHLFSYTMFERFLKHHVFKVDFDPATVVSGVIPFPHFVSDLQSVILPGKSAYTFLLLVPGLELQDALVLGGDALSINTTLGLNDIIGVVDNTVLIGDRSWKVGGYYNIGVGGIEIHAPPIGTRFADGKVPIIVGGTEPSQLGGPLVSGTVGWFFYTAGAGYMIDYSGWSLIKRSDIGRYVFRVSDGSWHEILSVEYVFLGILPVTTVTFGPASIRSSTENESWKIYDVPTNANVVDWGVGITTNVVPVDLRVVGWNDRWFDGYGSGLQRTYDGGSWLIEHTSSRGDVLHRVWGSAANDVWAVGSRFSTANSQAIAYHWDGNVWSLRGLLGEPGVDYEALSIFGITSDDVWLGGRFNGNIYHWDGTTWSAMPAFGTNFITSSLWGSASNNVYAVGVVDGVGGAVYRWNGSGWVLVDPTGGGSEPYYRHVWGFAADDVWVSGANTLYHWNGTTWASFAMPTGINPYVLHGVASNDIWMAGWDSMGGVGALFHWNGSAWTRDTSPWYDKLGAPATAIAEKFIGVWQHGATDVFVLAQGERPAESGVWASTVLRWNGTDWRVVHEDVSALRFDNGIWGF